ncbi:MAG: glycosyltransferase [Planctomycetota bacterium]|nr:glycosyltransferase [Planctomycetota bacterium]
MLLLPLLLALSGLATISFLVWLAFFFDPQRFWDFQPVGDDTPIHDPESEIRDEHWPPVCIIVPARNEAQTLPRTFPALLNQDYPGSCTVVLVDDRSSDGTADAARPIAEQFGRAERLQVIAGAPLPEGWVGKVWALQQGIQNAKCKMQNVAQPRIESGPQEPVAKGQEPEAKGQEPAFFLLTDADILHAPGSLRRLVAESVSGQLGLNSRMARLRCQSQAERLLIPAFVFFFNMLYPMRRVNSFGDKRTAAAAGGCMLLSREALEKIGGGLDCIRGEIIDDVNLARQVKRAGCALALSLSRNDVRSLREYPRLSNVWRMVRRTAFTELKYSWLRLIGALLGLGLLFVVPVLSLLGGLAGLLAAGSPAVVLTALWATLKGLLTLALMRCVYGPAASFFDLPRRYAYTLPLAGVLYGLMTLDSALRHARGAGVQWRTGKDEG